MLSIGATPSAARPDVSERREGFRKLMRLAATTVTSCRVEERTLPGPAVPLAARLYEPEHAPAGLLPGLVYFHGGGLVAGSLDTHDGLSRMLADAACCRVLSVAYRLAPEHKFPAAVDDACAAAAWISAQAATFGIDPRRLAVGGDSAGGTLAAVTCQWAQAVPGPQIAAQLLLCPVLDFTAQSSSRRAFAQGYLLDQATMERDLEHYLGSDSALDDPRISPLRAADLSGLPPTLIHTAEFDPLRDEGHAYAERLRKCGVPVRHTCHRGMIHHFYAMTAVIPQARAILKEIGAELRAALA